MITRHSLVNRSKLFVAAALVGVSLLAVPVAIAAGQPEAAVKPADTQQQPWYGMLNDDNVYIRSGPSDETYYATAKMNKAARVTVVGSKNDWLKILPPEGSFCYVAKAYVEKRGDGTVGRVTKPDLNVRAGSTLNSMKTTVQTSLEEGDDVKIVGEETEYFKIAPPPGAYLYVKKTFVDPAPQLASNTQPPAVPAPTAEPRMSYPIASDPVPVVTPPVAITPVAIAPVAITPVAIAPPVAVATPAVTAAVAPTTQPMSAMAAPATQPTVVAAVPTTKPTEPSADEMFGTVEQAFLDATNLPLDQQPVDALIAQYSELSTDSALAVSERRIADRRIATLKVRAAAKQNLLDAQKMKAEADKRQLALKAENDELADQLKQHQLTVYSAIGTLRISSLQQTGMTMYRLTDPGTGHTLVYIRSNDAKYAEMLNKFVGVKGDIIEDANLSLKVIAPTATDVVDPAKLNTNVTATIIPPSMIAKTATATIVGN